MHYKGTGVAQHTLLKNNLHLTLRHGEPRDAEQLLAFLNQVAGESENLTFGPSDVCPLFVYGLIRPLLDQS